MVYDLLWAILALFYSTVFGSEIQNEVFKAVYYIVCAIAWLVFIIRARDKEKELLKRIKRLENKQNEYILMEDLKEGRTMYDFKTVKGHVEVYYNGEFICTADNMDEALKDAEAHAKGEM